MIFRNQMSILTNKLAFRNSGTQAELLNNKINKSSSSIGKAFATKRMNTDGNQKSNIMRKYLVKKGPKGKCLLSNNLSKQNINPHRGSDFWNRISFNQFEWDYHPTQNATIAHKKSSNFQEKSNGKKKQLQNVIRKRNLRKTNNIQLSGANIKQQPKQTNLLDKTQSYQTQSKYQSRKLKTQISKNEEEERYEIISSRLLGAGTFGKVYSAIDRKTQQQVAVKRVFNDKSYKCRQIQLMEAANSPFVVKMIDKYTTFERDNGTTKQYVNLVMPKYQSSLYEFLRKTNYLVDPNYLKLYLYQMFRGILHLHSKGICHRDLKPQNILISNNRIAVCDLGSAKILRKDETNISYICSRCYRAPELIFGATNYTVSVDMWSAGCIILEILNQSPFFIAKDSLHHLIQIMKVMGTPSKKEVLLMNPTYDISTFNLGSIRKTDWHHIFFRADPSLLDLVSKIMVYNPAARFNAAEALCHQYFDDVRKKQFLNAFRGQIDISDFFKFDQNEKGLVNKSSRLIPKWVG